MLIINKKTKKNLKKLLIMFVFILFSVIILSGINKRIMPVLIETSCLEVKSFADKTIDNVVRQSIDEMDLKSSDFISVHNETKTVSADTVLVNNLCSVVDSKLDEAFSKQGKKKIAIPLGAASGVDILSNTGPDVSFTLVYKDDTSVDYETSFTAAGINQTNYKVWLTVEVTMRLVNPLKSTDVTATRKIMLIDTIIKGVVPQTYFRIDGNGSVISQ